MDNSLFLMILNGRPRRETLSTFPLERGVGKSRPEPEAGPPQHPDLDLTLVLAPPCCLVKVKPEPKAPRGPRGVKQHGVMDGPDMPVDLRFRIQTGVGGHHIRMILQKRVQESDIKGNENRFSMAQNQLSEEFLNDTEKAECEQRRPDNKRILGKQVRVMSRGGAQRIVCLKLWVYKRSKSYVFCGNNYKHMKEDNALQVDDVVQVWFFRDGADQPCFALVNLNHQ